VRKIKDWFVSYGLIYGEFGRIDLRDTSQPSAAFWQVFRKMLCAMEPIEGEGCTVKFQGEHWRLRLYIGRQPVVEGSYIPDDRVFTKLKELAKKRIRPYRAEIYEHWAAVCFCIGQHTEGKTKYMVEITCVRD
jgi:hypothetical protein